MTHHQQFRRTSLLGATVGIAISVVVMVIPGNGIAAAATTVQSVVDLGAVVSHTTPSALGVGSSTYGANPLSSAAQSDAERRLDARAVRIPVGYRNGRVTSSAAGASNTLDVPALVARYRSWGYQILAVIGGRTNDVDVQPGDATKIIQALGFIGIEYTAPNEPGNQGKTLQDQVNLANMITAEGRAIKSDFKIVGPVWAYYDRGQLGSFATSMGSKLGGLDYHHYAMGSQSLSTAQAMSQTPSFGVEVSQVTADLAARGLAVPVTVDELNFSWRYQDGTPGGNNRFFTAVNTVWMTSALGHILRAGGRGMPYATQNGPLGVMVESGQVNPDNRPPSSPMPAYWGMANWTGAHVWPHYKDTFYSATSSDINTEVFAVNNEAGGYNVLMLNKSEGTSKDMSLRLRGAGNGTYTSYRNNPSAPYAQPAMTGAKPFTADVPAAFTLPPMTVTVLVVSKGGGPPTTTSPSTSSSTSTSTSTSATPTSTPSLTVPTAPTGVEAARSAGGATAAVSWKPPLSTGGSPITGYRVTRDGADSNGGGAYATTVSAAARTFSFTLLQPAAVYHFTVTALNAIGAGPTVSVTSGTGATATPTNTPTTAPVTTSSAPVNPLPGPATSVAATGLADPTGVALTWRPPTTTTSTITGYRIGRDGTDSTGGGGYTTTVGPTLRTFSFTLLNHGSTYHFGVQALTSSGAGPISTVTFKTP